MTSFRNSMTNEVRKTTILVVDDDREMVSMLRDVLEATGYRAATAYSGAEALAIIGREEPDLMISDLRMSGMNGDQLQKQVKRVAPSLPVVIITAFGSIEPAVKSMRLGAFDYVTKPFSNDELLLVVARALEDRELRREVIRLRSELAHRFGLDQIIARNPKMLAQFEVLRQVADTSANVVITGESGVGEHLFAPALHCYSQGRSGAFVPLNDA